MNQDRDFTAYVQAHLQGAPRLRPETLQAVFEQVAATPQRGRRGRPLSLPSRRFQSISGAVSFVVAGAVVALFVGFLLAGVPTTQDDDRRVIAPGASASTEAVNATDLLPGVDLLSEQIGPGTYRIVNDGVRDPSGRNEAIVAGADGSVWIFRRDRFFRLGHEADHRWSDPDFAGMWERDDIEVGPDGTVWWADRASGPDEDETGTKLRSFDGQEWTTRRSVEGHEHDEVEVLDDGTVLTSWSGGARGRIIARLTTDGWEAIASARVDGAKGTLIAESPTRLWWLQGGNATRNPLTRGDFPDGVTAGQGIWTTLTQADVTDGTCSADQFEGVDVSRDGTVWAVPRYAWCDEVVDAPSDRIVVFYQFDGTSWASTYDRALGVDWERMKAASDGALWAVGELGLGRIVRTQAGDFRRSGFLPGVDVSYIEVDPRGNVWVQSRPSTDGAVYVLTPEAWAATR